MDINEAAKSLANELRGRPWLTGIGIGDHDGQPCIYLYVSSLKNADLGLVSQGWAGFHVEVRKMGQPRPLHWAYAAEPPRK